MKAKRLMMALLVALLVSGLFTFWLSRRLGNAAHVELRQSYGWWPRSRRSKPATS